MYTTFPGSITPTPTTPGSVLPTPVPSPYTVSRADGEVEVYPSRSIDVGQVYTGVEVTRTEGVGPVRTVVPPAPTEVSWNNEGSGICRSIGSACGRAYLQFEDDRLYTQYAAYAAEVHAFLLQGITFGTAHCIAMFKCEDYGLGMTGRQIKDA
jgi:hypothetical protein